MTKFDQLINSKSKLYENIIGSKSQPGVTKPTTTTGVPPIAGTQTTTQQPNQTQQTQQTQQTDQKTPQKQTDPLVAAQDAINILMQNKDNPAVQKLLATALQQQNG